ncbi:MAG TPA: hypothetical protein VFE36_14065 [Candidatus Baltobacteraceae bacterium]|nr:hypothetical protein [Candidatus Baltobacteraceae bacterium]
MRPTIFALGVLALATACSGGSPVPSASLSPSANGARYTFVSSSYGVEPGVYGKPMPIPTSSASERNVVTTNVSFGGMHSLVEIARTPVGAQGKPTSNEYFAMTKSNGITEFEEVAARDTSDSGFRKQRFIGKHTVTFTMPFVVVELPFSAGRTWSRSAAYRDISDYRSYHPANVRENGETVYSADGSYSTVATGAELGKVLHSRVTLASDGSYREQARLGPCRQTLDVDVPVMKSGTYVIPYEATAKGCMPAPAPAATSLPDWYPGGALPPSPLRTANATDMGAAAIPASCGVAPSIATRGEKIAVTRTDFSPLGVVTHGVETSYFATGIGLVCTETVTISEQFAVQPPAAKYIGRSVIHTVRSLVSYTKGSTVGAPAGFPAALEARGEILRVGGMDRIP